ncbi:MAG TPA: hypothetical protein VK811_02210 [Candidatus Acidoferrum sp.]|nr:hypothetical protein [Candidatus Acidoferrum sp.]
MIKTFFCALLLVTAWQRAQGFALLGPIPGTPAADLSVTLPTDFGDAWQVDTLGYDAPSFGGANPGDSFWFGDLGGPKNIGEGYRRNDPVLYYASDGTGGSFQKFFGPQGEAAVDQAFAILNNFFTNTPTGVDGYSANLSEFPFNSQSFNGTAQGLYLTDLKSVTLHLLVEQLGLTEPERYTWTLENRYLPPGGTCPVSEEYIVVQRNFATTDQPLSGPETGTLYSPYVNDILYTYGISEVCTIPSGSTFKWLATTEPFAVQDPGKPEFTAVAANDYDGLENLGPGGGLEDGGFYTGLTEDDAAGLRYLMTSNNIVLETPATGGQLEATNTGTQNLLMTSDLHELLQFAQTNPPAIVQAAFPNLEIESVSNYFTLGSNPIVTAFLETPAGSPQGTEIPEIVTNGWTFFAITNFSYTFGNIVYVHYYTNTVAQQQTVSIGLLPKEVATGPLFTNVNYQTVIQTNVPSGDYYIIPPGSCGLDIFSTMLTNNFVSATTNVIAAATNSAGFVGSVNVVTYFTNDWFNYYSCNFETSSTAYYQGIQKIQFIRVSDNNVDPLTDTFYTPITNSYSMVWWNPTNSQLGGIQTFERVVTTPDFLFNATPQASGPAGLPVVSTVERDIHFEDGQIVPGLSGPGVIDGQTTFTYDDIGTVWWNGPFLNTNSYVQGNVSEVNQTTQEPSLLWASYDETTNTPVVYPNNLNIQEMESQMIITVSPTNLPDGTNGAPYTPTYFTATGGTPSYSWSVSPNTPLPSGLGLIGNELEGEPNGDTNGVYDVTIQMTDSSLPANTVLMNYTITIH